MYNERAWSIWNCLKADKFPTEMNIFHNNFEKQRQTAIKTAAQTETERQRECYMRMQNKSYELAEK